MQYKGKLYGKVAGKYIELNPTSTELEMLEQISEIKGDLHLTCEMLRDRDERVLQLRTLLEDGVKSFSSGSSILRLDWVKRASSFLMNIEDEGVK